MKTYSKDCIMKRRSNDIDGELITVEDVEGINFPFQIYIPYNRSDLVDVVLSNNTPGVMQDYTYTEALGFLKEELKIKDDGTLEKTKNNKYINGVNPLVRFLSYDCKNICIIPCIPRPYGIDSSYLGYSMFHNDFDFAINAIKEGKSKYTIDEINKYIDLDKQVYKMIQCTMDILDEKNINHESKIIITGYSAGSKFSNFFTALHTDIVKAVIAGGTGGNNIIPDNSINQTYPVGVSDLINFNQEQFKSIPQFYYIGDKDYNDLAKYKPKLELETDEEKIKKYGKYMRDIDGNTIPKRNDGLKGYHDEVIDGEIKHIPDKVPFDKIEYDLDENGNYQCAYDGGYYTLEQIDYIVHNLGDNVQDRFDKIAKIYSDLNINAIFKKYPGNHQTIFNNYELFDDVNSFIEKIKQKNINKSK